MANEIRYLFLRSVFLLVILAVAACTRQTSPVETTPMEADQMLTLEAIFKDHKYDPKEPGQIRWLDDGSGYTALETVDEYRDVDPERDE